MKRLQPSWVFVFAFAVSLFASAGYAGARDDIVVAPHAAVEFATLPDDVRFPEGITANPANGDIYVANFEGGGTNAVLRYNRSGRLVARNDFPGMTPILGLAFNPHDNKVYLASVDDFTTGGSSIRRIAADFDGDTAAEPWR